MGKCVDADLVQVGPAAANLGALAGGGLPVAPGFVITKAAYLRSISGIEADLWPRDEVRRLTAGDLAAVHRLASVAADRMGTMTIDPEVRAEISAAHRRIDPDGRERFELRLSPIVPYEMELPPGDYRHSYAGAIGRFELFEAVAATWAQLFDDESVDTRWRAGDREFPVAAVIVQRMVVPDRSGVVFTADPMTGATQPIVVFGAFGEGEVVDEPDIAFDSYVVDRHSLTVVEDDVEFQDHALIHGLAGSQIRLDLSDAAGSRRKLDVPEIQALVRLALAAEDVVQSPVRLDWCIAQGKPYVLGARAVHTDVEA